MKKVGLITLNGYHNYGNRLQNYALQEAIKMLNFECDTVINNTVIQKSIEKDKFTSFKNKTLIEQLKSISNKINNIKLNKIRKKRTNLFIEFSNKYINETSKSISIDNIPNEIIEKYDYFISGSDQVWNPNDSLVSEINFLTFAPKCKRITYAPSFGISNIPENYKAKYKKWLLGINAISVREEDGAKIIKDLTKRDAPVIIDPTMLMSKEKWLTVSKKDINKPKEQYLLTYFLGEISKKYKAKIKKISEKNNLKVVNLADVNSKKYYVSGPNEFIDYINSANLFLTDSFHGCVFSLLLETPFIVCDRVGHTEHEKMNSRIDTFLRKFKLQNRKFNEIEEKNIFYVNYKESLEILDYEREKAWKYLKQALNIEN